jgi:hypothetical protein
MGSNRRAGATRTGPFRAHPRRNVRLRALITHVAAGWQRHASVENMGLGGARVLLDERLAAGDAVTLSFTAPTLWDPLVLRARVAWVVGGTPHYSAGLAFEHKTADAVLALYELIVTLGYE